MIELLALAAALVAGVDPRRVVLLAASLYLPLVVLALVALVSWRWHRSADSRSALFCEGVAAELRSGSPIRDALATAATSVGSTPLTQLTHSGAPMTEVAQAVARLFPDVGRELELTIKTAARSGGNTADLFDEIGSLAIAHSEIAHEVRIASAPARATAFLFVVAPALFVTYKALSGGISVLLASPAQRIVSLAGLGLFLTGLAVAFALMRRSW